MNGTELRDLGVAAVDRNTDSTWKLNADDTIRAMSLSGYEFTAEDIREFAGDPPTPNAMGARFLAASRSGLIKKIGYRNARRPDAHARALAVYRGA